MSAPPLESIGARLRSQPVLLLLAGPNGAGKSTFFAARLDDLGLPFVNADRIARMLRDTRSDVEPGAIDRLAFAHAEEIRRGFLAARVSFCAETVFSDPVGAKVSLLRDARAAGFATFLIFIGLASADLSIARVMQRVREGGHDVADDRLIARYPRTLANLRAAVPIVDEAFLYDNSSPDAPYRVVAVYADGQLVRSHTPLPPWTRGLPGL